MSLLVPDEATNNSVKYGGFMRILLYFKNYITYVGLSLLYVAVFTY